ncbi:hypothetical protein [Streptomyces sp. NPDC058045]|uniref:hypothetical protein n=1 Tax=Streptomyces sp. NPDC058045 TaxID=3346311 RepID=UPI0036E2119C
MNRRIPVAATALAATAMVLGTGASSPFSAPASPSQEQGAATTASSATAAKCRYHAYSSVGWPRSWMGKDTEKYNNGYTKVRGRTLVLATGNLTDRSAAHLLHARKGDRVWVDISHSKGKNWVPCGSRSAKSGDKDVYSKAYVHSSSDVKNRYMRACAKTDGHVWCARYGNEINSDHSDHKTRYWWFDS